MIMIRFSKWCQLGVGSCCMLVAAALLSTAAAADTSSEPAFAQRALVTHWSLPQPEHAIGTLPQPLYAHLADLQPDMAGYAPPPATLPTSLPTAAHAVQLAGPTLADDDLEARGYVQPDSKQRYRMPRDIKRLQIAFQVLNAADAVTTLACLKQDDCKENNPIYGKHPKPIVVIGAKTLVGAAHYYAMRSLAEDYPGLARALGWVTVSVQGGVVGLNLSRLL